MKYVHHERFGVVLFPANVMHLEVAMALPGGLDAIKSAGFADLTSLKCHGKSISLGLSADPSDSTYLKAFARD